MEENDRLKHELAKANRSGSGGGGASGMVGSGGNVVNDQLAQEAKSNRLKYEKLDKENNDLAARNGQMRREMDLQAEQLRNLDKKLAELTGKQAGNYTFDIDSDEETMPYGAKKTKLGK